MEEKKEMQASDKVMAGALNGFGTVFESVFIFAFRGILIYGVGVVIWRATVDIAPFWFTGLSNAIFGGVWLWLWISGMAPYLADKTNQKIIRARDRLMYVGIIWAVFIETLYLSGAHQKIGLVMQLECNAFVIALGFVMTPVMNGLLLGLSELLFPKKREKFKSKLKPGVVRSGDAMAEVAAQNKITDALDQDY